jgi:rare lipoprotein A
VCALVCGALVLPASGWAASGGSGLTPGGSQLAPAPAAGGSQGPGTGNGDVTVSATGNGISLQTRASAILRKGLTFTGTAPQNLAGDTVEIERSGHETNWQWAPTVSGTIGSDGSFSASWQTDHIGRFAIRAVVSSATVAQSASTAPTLTTTVYRPSLATQYGPGFYGKRTACGQRLKKGMIGVANRTLKCGTSVAVYYQGRTMIVPVIDRGPYANGADWDLTEATGKALGIDGTAQIDAVSLPTR